MKEIEYKIYGLKDPLDNMIKYIGLSKNVESRYKQHFYSKNSDKSDWIDELKKIDLRPELIILDTITTCDRNNALNKEKQYIKEYKDKIYNKHGVESNIEKWTTLSIDTDVKPMLEKIMIKMMVEDGKRYTYSQIIKKLGSDYLDGKE